MDSMSSSEKETKTVVPKNRDTSISTEQTIVATSNGETKDQEYLPTSKLILVTIGLALGVFAYGLDTTILATAIPRITDDFGALNDVGWYGAAYFFCSSAFQLLFGKLFTIFSVKIIYFCALGLFELGSIVCATAPNSPALIVGRALAGIGAAGLYSGSVVVLSHSAPLAKRPLLTSLLGAALGIASIIGPFLGGAFTDNVTWRWCFWINLPIGAVTFVLVLLFVKIPRDPRYKAMRLVELLAQLDLPGIILLIPSIICLLLALQWGGTTYHWGNARIIVLLILAIVLGIGFVLVERFSPKTRAISPTIFKTRTTAFVSFYGACLYGAFMVAIYYLPLWFQGVQQVDAIESGVHNIPMILAFVVSAILCGALTNAIGYYTPLMLIACIITAVGAGMLSTLKPDASSGQWIGYQVLFGFGIGFGIQQPLLAVQTVLSQHDVPIGITLVTLLQNLFGAVLVAIAQNVFQNELSSNIKAVIPDFDAAGLVKAGATQIAKIVPASQLDTIITAYSLAIDRAFYVAVAVASLSIIGALGTEWKSVKNGSQQDGTTDDASDSASPA